MSQAFNAFRASLSDFSATFTHLEEHEQRLLASRDALASALQQDLAADGVLAESNPLNVLARATAQAAAEMVGKGTQAWHTASPMRQLSAEFQDRVILLVFGKVNAGKSAFCNFIASRFPAETLDWFCIENGEFVAITGPFAEGVTETTSRIQGVRIGERLVLIDSPGLHSVTAENGALTRRFTDAADAVLLLTSSTSPGQVQELDDLRQELALGKVMLPVISRSDSPFPEEVNGAVVTRRIPKSARNRAEQEADVFARAAALLDEKDRALLLRPVSLSVKVCRDNPQPDGFADLGMERLFDVLIERVTQARQFKGRKAAVQLVSHLERDWLQPIRSDLLPKISAIESRAGNEADRLEKARASIRLAVLAQIYAELPPLIEAARARKDATQLRKQVEDLLGKKLHERMTEELREFTRELSSSLVSLSGSDLGEFTEIAYEHKVVEGHWKQGAATVAATVAGGLLGALAGPLGAAAGAMIGGMLGNKGGEYLLDVRFEREVLGVSSEKVLAGVRAALDERLPAAIDKVIDGCVKSVRRVGEYGSTLKQHIETFEQAITREKSQIQREEETP